MDPNKNLKEQLDCAQCLIAAHDHDQADDASFIDDAVVLAQPVLALDNWIRKGGLLPKEWEKK